MTTYVVSSAAQLMTAAAQAKGGDSITLTGGTYTAVDLSNIHPNGIVTISSQSGANPVFLSELTVNTCSNLKFNHIGIDASSILPNQYGGSNTWVVNVYHSDSVSFIAITAHGLSGVTLNNSVSGINIEDSTNTTVSQSSFQNFHNAVSVYEDTGFSAASNSFSHIFDDGIHGGGTSNVNIVGNTFTDFHEDASDADHPDTIQFFTLGLTTSASHFYIANNTYIRGDGNPVQGIFFRDETGDLPYHYITVINNNYTGTSYNGIRIDGATSVNISSNILSAYTDYYSGIILQNTVNATVDDNSSDHFSYTNVTGLQSAGNVVTGDVQAPNLPATMSIGSMFAAGRPLSGQIAPSAAPEPTAWITLLLGLMMGGAALRRRRQRSLRAV